MKGFGEIIESLVFCFIYYIGTVTKSLNFNHTKTSSVSTINQQHQKFMRRDFQRRLGTFPLIHTIALEIIDENVQKNGKRIRFVMKQIISGQLDFGNFFGLGFLERGSH